MDVAPRRVAPTSATLALVKDWLAWHEDYDDPSSALSRRLVVVRRRLTEALDAPADRPRRLLSLCAGDGRDVIPVSTRSPSMEPLSCSASA
jgi:hypothetical protein